LFIDIQSLVGKVGIEDLSLQKIYANLFRQKISKKQRLTNWDNPDLRPDQLVYAATDAWVCREMYLKLLESEKHPLTPEEMMPPQERLAHEQAVARKEANIAAEKARANTSKRRKSRRKKKKSWKKPKDASCCSGRCGMRRSGAMRKPPALCRISRICMSPGISWTPTGNVGSATMRSAGAMTICPLTTELRKMACVSRTG
jgi:hypothetical protein